MMSLEWIRNPSFVIVQYYSIDFDTLCYQNLAFTSDGVEVWDIREVRVENQISQSYQICKLAGRIRMFHFFQFCLWLSHLRYVENQIVRVRCRHGRISQSHGPESNNVIGVFFCLCFQLCQSSFHKIIPDKFISRIGVLLDTPMIWFSLDQLSLNTDFNSYNDSVTSENRAASKHW